VPPAIDSEANRSEDVHPLIDARLTAQAAGGEKAVGKQDQDGAGPADDLDRDLLSAQAASLLST
jgi:hypothetical protein